MATSIVYPMFIRFAQKNCRYLGKNGRSCEQSIALRIQIETMEEVLEVAIAIKTAFEDFEIDVESFDKTTVLSIVEVVGDFLPSPIERFQEAIKH